MLIAKISRAGQAIGCKSFAPDGYNIFYSNIGIYQGEPLYDRYLLQHTFSDINCLQATGSGCFIRLTNPSECNNGCNSTPDENGYYFKPGLEYNFDPDNPQAMCDLDGLELFLIVVTTGAGLYRIKKYFNG